MSGAGGVCTPPVGGRYRAEFGKPAGRGAVFDGVGLCPAGGPVNKFPAHRQGLAPAPVGTFPASPDWKARRSGGMGKLGKEWLAVRVAKAKTSRNFPSRRRRFPNLTGAAKGRATGLTPHEARFNVASGSAQTREARPRQFPCLGAVAPKLREDADTLHFTDPLRGTGIGYWYWILDTCTFSHLHTCREAAQPRW